jgi:pimeloyl-ACP methyl ester carboxylesterase
LFYNFVYIRLVFNHLLMTKKITLLSLLFCSAFGFAQQFEVLKSQSQTKIIYDQVIGLSDVAAHPKNNVNANYFKQVYYELQRADSEKRLTEFAVLKDETTRSSITKQLPLSVLITQFESLSTEAIAREEVYKNNQDQWIAKPNTAVFNTHHLALAAPLNATISSLTNTFVLPNKLVFNTTNKTISAILANFNDGQGWRTVNFNQAITVTFPNQTTQKIDFRIQFTDGTEKTNSAEIDYIPAVSLRNPGNTSAITTINATIPYQGVEDPAAYLGQGEYEIFYDNGNGVLDKPIILLDGFDPNDGRPIPAIYGLLNYGTTGQNLADDLRNQGFDVIILNFPNYTQTETGNLLSGGADYIQRNAMVFVELLNQINAQKVGNEKNVVIGPSMGGLIARYGLRYMEQHSQNHDTRLYLSFDAPHYGANIPIGFQHLFNYMANGPLGDATVQVFVDAMIKSNASRQMLIDQFEGHLAAGSTFEFDTAIVLPTGKPNFRTAFQNELNSMGFPTLTRNVAISNGSGNGTTNGTPDAVAMDHTFNITTTQRAIINLRLTPNTNQQNQVSRFRAQGSIFGFWITAYESLANSKAPTTSAGLDTAPGGTFDISGLAGAAGSNALLTEFFNNLLIDSFDFVPTNSSLGINIPNWYTAVTPASVTPFAAKYVPLANEAHVTLTPENTTFALNEILNNVFAVQEQAFADITVQNPIRNSINLNCGKVYNDVSICLTDITGKTILHLEQQTLEGFYQLPVTLTRGMYFLTLQNEAGKITKKLIRE